jgi:dTDP-glucose 4,6-dehydratase
MKNLLVTGGAGFIGSNFIHYMLSHEPDLFIVNLDALTYAGSASNLEGLPAPDRHIFIEGDIVDRALIDRLLREHTIDTIIHFAAETHVDRSILDPGRFIETNVIGTYTLLEAARQYWLVEQAQDRDSVRFHHVSTDEVFGSLGPGDPAFNEDTPYDPRSPYSASKASSDHLVRAYFHTYGLPISITNCSNNYGPFQFPEKLIPVIIANALDGSPLPIYGDGMQIRDWLYVDDHSEAIRRVIRSGRAGETYSVGGDNQPPNIEIVQTLCAILDELAPDSGHAPHDQLITYVTDRPGHDRRYDVAIDKLRDELGWEPQESLHTGLLKTVEWYLANQEWVAEIRTREDYQTWMARNYTKR